MWERERQESPELSPLLPIPIPIPPSAGVTGDVGRVEAGAAPCPCWYPLIRPASRARCSIRFSTPAPGWSDKPPDRYNGLAALSATMFAQSPQVVASETARH